MLAGLVTAGAGTTASAAAVGTDIPATHWAYDDLQTWIRKGLLLGDADGSVRPDGSVTRAEFMALVNRMEGLSKISAAVGSFSDVSKSDWFYNDVAKALAAGYISGYEDGTMHPNDPITRYEAAMILARLADLPTDSGYADILEYVTDGGDAPSWVKVALASVISAGYIAGTDGYFLGDNNITRAETVTMLNRYDTGVLVIGFDGTYDGFLYCKTPATATADADYATDYSPAKSVLITAEAVALKPDTVSTTIKSLEIGGAVTLKGVKVTNVTVTSGTAVLTGTSSANTITGASATSANVIIDKDFTGTAPVLKGQLATVTASADMATLTISGTVSSLILDATVDYVAGFGAIQAVTANATKATEITATVRTAVTGASKANVTLRSAIDQTGALGLTFKDADYEAAGVVPDGNGVASVDGMAAVAGTTTVYYAASQLNNGSLTITLPYGYEVIGGYDITTQVSEGVYTIKPKNTTNSEYDGTASIYTFDDIVFDKIVVSNGIYDGTVTGKYVQNIMFVPVADVTLTVKSYNVNGKETALPSGVGSNKANLALATKTAGDVVGQISNSNLPSSPIKNTAIQNATATGIYSIKDDILLNVDVKPSTAATGYDYTYTVECTKDGETVTMSTSSVTAYTQFIINAASSVYDITVTIQQVEK